MLFTFSFLICSHHRSRTMARLSHTKAILGKNLFAAVRETPLLVVGAGGIGCELRELPKLPPGDLADKIVKNLVLVGFANIEIVSSCK
jgi:ubiquitin-like 1-activating enzyme E1 B